MRILFATGIYPPDVGGPATYTYAMARALLDAGHQAEIVCYADAGFGIRNSGFGIRGAGTRRADRRGTPAACPYDGRHRIPDRPNSEPLNPKPETRIRVHCVNRSLFLPIRYAVFAWKVYRAAKKADLVYLQGPVSEGFPGTIGAMLARKPTVMKVVGDYAWEMYMQESGGDKMLLDEFIQADVGARRRRAHRKTIKIRLIERIERWTAKRAKQIIVPSEYLKTIVEQWGIPSEKIEVIYNAVDSISDFSVKTREEVRRGMGLDGKHVLSSVVRCIPWKRIDFIIRLLPKLPEDIHFVLAGDGPMLKNWKMLAEEIGVSSRIHFLGRVHQLKVFEICRAADLFVLPSGYEGFPHVIPEAASEGLHSFVSDKGGNPEMLEILGPDFVTVLPYLDEKAWLDALQGEWPKRSAQNLPNVLTIQSMVDRTESLLKQCI